MKMKNLFRALTFGIVLMLLVGCREQSTPDIAPESEDEIIFYSDQTRIKVGQCTILRWEVEGDHEVIFNGEVVHPTGEVEVCPPETQVFELNVDFGSHMENRFLEIAVSGEMDEPPAEEPEMVTPSQPESGREAITPGIPAYQAGKWVRLGGPPGGIGYDIRMRPDNPDVMFVTDVSAGVSKSVDGGRTWVRSNNGIPPDISGGYPIFTLTIDPHDFDTIWVGTYLNGHVYHSTDNGATWEQRDNGIITEARSWRGITVDPNDPDIVYLAGEETLDEMNTVAGEVYQSTDAGASWQLIWRGDNCARYVWVDPRDSNRLYVSTGIFDRVAKNANYENEIWGGVGILRSDDRGQTWTILNEGNGLEGILIPSLFMHPEDPDTLIAAATNPFGGPMLSTTGVYVTYDGGESWQQILQNPDGGMEAVEIAISNPDIWYAAGTSDEGTKIWRSDDAGQHWQSYLIRTAHRGAGFPIDLQVDPRDSYRIFDNNYGGGNFLSEDGGQTWVDASRGYTGAIIPGIDVGPGDGRTVFVPAFRSEDGGQTWVGGLDATSFHFSPDAKHIVAVDKVGNAWHSDDGGQNWQITTIFNVDHAVEAGLIADVQNHARAFAVAPSDPQTLYVGYAHQKCIEDAPISFYCVLPTPVLARSQDGGYTWEQITDTPFKGVAVLGLAVLPDDPQTVYAATAVGLYLSHDGGDSWQRLVALEEAATKLPPGSNEPPPEGGFIVFDVVLDPFDPQVVYAATQQYALWRSNDGGQTWAQAAAGMDPNEPLFDLEPDLAHEGVFYASSSWSGVFVTTNGGQSWQGLTDGLDFNNITDLALTPDGSVLYAGSSGSGVFRLGTP